MSSKKPQAISGVSADVENVVRIEYQSFASTDVGCVLGSLYECIPLKIGSIKLSYLLFTLPTVPIALLWYIVLKLTGQRYVLTNRAVQKWSSLGNRLIAEVPLAEIDDLVVEQSAGQVFYKAADLDLIDAGGSSRMRLKGVTRAEVFRQTIIAARDARRQVEQALATIQARQTA